jgi:hypothetical protein
VDVTFDGGQIIIKVQIKPPADAKPEDFWLRENFCGKSSRQITLAEDALGDQAKAPFMNAVLTLTVPKAQPAKPKSIRIPITGGPGANSELGNWRPPPRSNGRVVNESQEAAPAGPVFIARIYLNLNRRIASATSSESSMPSSGG